MPTSDLVARYNVPGPRYTSYPTVPYWDAGTFTVDGWRATVRRAFDESNAIDGIALYVHLPFCESLCTFCGCTKRITRNHAVESPYVDDLLREWDGYLRLLDARPRLREVHLGGGTPTFFSPASLERLVAGLLEGAELAPGAELGFEAHPNSTTGEHLAALHGLGFRRLSLGVQDFDPVVQDLINRIQPLERVAAVTAAARETGYGSINFDLVYGLPRQTRAGIAATVNEVVQLRPERIAFYGYAHVPWIRGVGQRKFSEADLPGGADKLALYETGRELFEAAGYAEIGMDHFALPEDALHRASVEGHLHRNFMGYTPVHTRLGIGLGMSAIGDSWYGFAQNVKKVPDYAARLAAGEPTEFRGHLLDHEDLRVRRHILDLMCRFETRWDDAAEAPAGVLARLAPMSDDGLVEIGPGRVAVTARGRPFLRNACMAFDARLWRALPETRLFSSVV